MYDSEGSRVCIARVAAVQNGSSVECYDAHPAAPAPPTIPHPPTGKVRISFKPYHYLTHTSHLSCDSRKNHHHRFIFQASANRT